MIEVFFDGSCEPINPGGNGAIGFVIQRDGVNIHQASRVLGRYPAMTCNVAEYGALIGALEYLQEQGMTEEEILVRGDSQIVINAMKRPGGISNGLCRANSMRCRLLVDQFPHISFEWIPREQNGMADALSKSGQTGIKDWSAERRPKFYGGKKIRVITKRRKW